MVTELCEGVTTATAAADTHECTWTQSRQAQGETTGQTEFKGVGTIRQLVSCTFLWLICY